MAYYYSRDKPIPVNLFNPRWFLDRPPHLLDLWDVKFNTPDFALFYDLSKISYNNQYSGDRFTNHGANIIISTVICATKVLKSLLAEDLSKYALTFKTITSKLTSCQNNKSKGKEILSP